VCVCVCGRVCVYVARLSTHLLIILFFVTEKVLVGSRKGFERDFTIELE